jgi:hypothetical protein
MSAGKLKHTLLCYKQKWLKHALLCYKQKWLKHALLCYKQKWLKHALLCYKQKWLKHTLLCYYALVAFTSISFCYIYRIYHHIYTQVSFYCKHFGIPKMCTAT